MDTSAVPPDSDVPAREGAATQGPRQGSLTVAIIIAILMLAGTFFIPSDAFDGWVRHVLTAVVAGVVAGLLLRIRGFWRWLALLVVPSLIFWAVVSVVIFVVFLIFLPDGFIGD